MISLVDATLENYAIDHSTSVAPLMHELRDYTFSKVSLPQMQVGPLEGQFLSLLARLVGARRIVEVGTFTGYSALMMAESLPEEGELITCDIDPKAAAVAQSFFDRAPHGKKISLRLGPAAETLAGLSGPFDMAFIDADKVSYTRYFDLIRPKMRERGLIVIDNVLWSGRVLQSEAERDADTAAIVAFNTYLKQQADVQKIMLTVRDGMTLVVV